MLCIENLPMILRLSKHVTKNEVVALVCVFLLCTVALTGCSEEPSSSQSEEETSSQKKSVSDKTTKSTTAKSKASTSTSGIGRNVHTDATGRKWIGEIPYDVFFDNPLKIANDNRPVGGAANSSALDQPNDSPTSGGDTTPDKGTGWKSVVSMEILEAEVKRIRNSMTGSLRGVGQYNAGYKDIQIDGGTLAAVAGIIIGHPDPINWKEDAKYIRDLGARIEERSQKLGKKSFDATLLSYEQFTSILNRSKPADLPEAEDQIPFADRTDRSTLMRRIDKAFQQMKSNVTTKAALEKQKEMVLHESAILAALTKVIITESYDLFDDEEYRKLSEQMYQASKAMETAVGSKDFSAFDKGLSSLNNACTQCHTSYRD
jgi:hypothetical protein